ncbi:MAG: dihydroneopterin aldolase [Chthoniobacteraceae bacterium]
MPDAIRIERLELSAHLGVPDDERADPQRLTVSVTLFPKTDFRDLGDDISRTIDYFEVCQRLKAEAASRPRRLLETLAEDLAARLLRDFPLTSVELELRKFILPDTAHVAAIIRRTA